MSDIATKIPIEKVVPMLVPGSRPKKNWMPSTIGKEERSTTNKLSIIRTMNSSASVYHHMKLRKDQVSNGLKKPRKTLKSSALGMKANQEMNYYSDHPTSLISTGLIIVQEQH